MDEILITNYQTSQSDELLRLLLQLHSAYFHQNAPKQFQELREERDIKKSYENYIHFINEHIDNDWKIFLAATKADKVIGFIIGSITKDDELVNGITGKFEDWLVEADYRGRGVGAKLYNELEKWFISKGCKQVMSDTWYGNELSIKAHKELGFFISGISFSKKIS